MRWLILIALFTATAGLADPPAHALSPDAFENYATGKTLAYAQSGTIWGRETYLPGRRVLWRAVGQDCKMGHWWADSGAVCFSYDDGTTSQCWQFAETPLGLQAHFLNIPGGPPAEVSEESNAVPCPGPDIGS